ncbi:MAG TPA: DAHL domain-containing protein [Burkholderiales bacterium]|nr:DAHL domain-containing protein [Burkholderiales bacterium]
MKTVLRFAIAGLILAALTAGWFYLYANSRAINAAQQSATLGLLKDIKQLDSDWSADVLKAQAEIIRSYDALIRPLRTFNDIFVTLEAETKRLGDADLQKGAEEIHTTIDKKAMLIDRFKAQNSLLKNSLRYAPTAHKDIRAQMYSERDVGMSEGARLMRDIPSTFDELEKTLVAASKADSATASRQIDAAIAALRTKMRGAKLADAATRGALTMVHLEGHVSTLVGEALRYNSVPDADTAELLKASIEKVRESSSTYPASVREAVDNLMSHLDAILNLRTKQMELLREISQVPVSAKVDAFGDALTARFEAELAQQYVYQQALLWYSAGALLLVFGAAGVITYRNATERRRLAELVDKQTKELKENEVQLVHAQKMNALGEMVAGITHEVNTPLAAVKSGLQSSTDLIGMLREYVDASGSLATMLSTPPPADDAGRTKRKSDLGGQLTRVNELHEELTSFDALGAMDQLLGEGIKNVEYIHQVVVNMLNFSRLDRSKISASKVEEGIDSTLIMARHFLKNIQLTKRFGDTKPINCDMAQINQVLLNLIKNAAQAMPDSSGEIVIETAMASAGEVSIAISDTGSGIPAENLSKIWEPFFTTKKAGSGTGLGLSTCKKIITSHGGQIAVKSEIGKGTTFTVTLPIQPSASLYEEHGQEMHSQFLATA